MAEFALINLDKREVVVSSDTGFGYKMIECVGVMPLATLWLFTVPVGGQPAPPPPPSRPSSPDEEWERRPRVKSPRVPVGYWAGDRVLLVDEYWGSAAGNFPPELISAFPNGDPSANALWYAFENLKRVNLPGYEHQGDQDVLFPVHKVWVVRNLTKKWYARSDRIVEPGDRRGPDLMDDAEGLGLGDLIWADIGGGRCARMGEEGGAGDRFDVQALESVQNPDEEWKEWKDWSEQAIDCLQTFDVDWDVSQFRR
ncbi:hypothetical protein FB45DRAFT_1051506 [Roridomyces roridus]|uniref:Uncharacterized protein n=1 Tax=Roridomyces roridus TaxID=1738132 RepID=A0AAD7CEH4_9AGAR|nr:hypothetical protein FB45DRAFT_1051506 [Roridomyces roridus]